eukprot:463996-Rhodomonas_salina.1
MPIGCGLASSHAMHLPRKAGDDRNPTSVRASGTNVSSYWHQSYFLTVHDRVLISAVTTSNSRSFHRDSHGQRPACRGVRHFGAYPLAPRQNQTRFWYTNYWQKEHLHLISAHHETAGRRAARRKRGPHRRRRRTPRGSSGSRHTRTLRPTPENQHKKPHFQYTLC